MLALAAAMKVSTVTTSDGSLLNSIRTTLRSADEALLCVAFVTQPGVHLLSREFRRLGSNTRMLVTTTFGTTSSTALSMAAAAGVKIGLLNPGSGQTYHPKLYLGHRGTRISAVVGSANLTGGLVNNVEAACYLEGSASHPSLSSAWEWAGSLWTDKRVERWMPGVIRNGSDETLTPDLLAYLQDEVERNNVFLTLGPNPCENRVTELIPTGVYVVVIRKFLPMRRGRRTRRLSVF
jgi:HKD family nuclease